MLPTNAADFIVEQSHGIPHVKIVVLLMVEILTASAKQNFAVDIANAIVLTLFVLGIMSSGGHSGPQAASLIIRMLAVQALRLSDWWQFAMRELPTAIVVGPILGAIGTARVSLWQTARFCNYGKHRLLAVMVGAPPVGIVTFDLLACSMLPFVLEALRFDPASASAPFSIAVVLTGNLP